MPRLSKDTSFSMTSTKREDQSMSTYVDNLFAEELLILAGLLNLPKELMV